LSKAFIVHFVHFVYSSVSAVSTNVLAAVFSVVVGSVFEHGPANAWYSTSAMSMVVQMCPVVTCLGSLDELIVFQALLNEQPLY
jgi:hypothetical protein